MENKKIKLILSFFVILSFGVGAVYAYNTNKVSVEEKVALFGQEMIVYKTETCGCCEIYTKYLERKGVNVKVVDLPDLVPIKDEFSIPIDFQSCHTSVVGGYFIEGHVPLEVIEKVLTEKPNIRGIALPGMPSGSPGMPGPKTSEWKIYGMDNDYKMSEYMLY